MLSAIDLNAGGIATLNPIRYRSYYYDTETGLYYLNSRYYDPETGRFVNGDDESLLTATPMALTDKNLFAYCDNNPIVRKDTGGEVWETVFDVISLGLSIVDVCKNPSDPWAWAGLVGDAIDLVPFVAGVGEIVRGMKTASKVADAVDGASDAMKAASNAEKAISSTKPLHRPYIRKSTRLAVEASTPRLPDGRFIDVNLNLPINGKYDLGHKPGHEFWRKRNLAMERGWSQKQFNDYMNNPDFYQIENPISNRSHKFEKRR